MADKNFLKDCKQPFPIPDEWLRQFCKKNSATREIAITHYAYIREFIKISNEMKMFTFIPDNTKLTMVKLIASHIVESELVKKAREIKKNG